MILKVKTSSTYEIHINAGVLDSAGGICRAALKAKRLLIVSDSNVAPVYMERVTSAFSAAGFEVSRFVFPAGEQSKTLATVEDIMAAACKAGLDRQDALAALGGGVTGDLTGFAAAIYKRGIEFIGIPTTLLSQVDSSVGGKTGCNLPSGKNLAGAFKQPAAVIIDPDVLGTLPKEYFIDGCGEVIKYGCILDESLFYRLEQCDFSALPADTAALTEIIAACVELKRRVVESDERDKGLRAILNFGHTVGHAIERYQEYAGLSHGEAVAAGMAAITEMSERKGLTEPGTSARLKALIQKAGLPVTSGIPKAALAACALGDKKQHGDFIDLVLLKSIGECYIHAVKTAEIEEFIPG